MSKPQSYRTRQRDLVLECLASGEDMTADAIAGALKATGNPVGKSTVYRRLTALVEEGLVRKYTTHGRESACYQLVGDRPACAAHCHLKCLGCGKLIHLENRALFDLERDVRESEGFELDSSKTVLYGKCQDCHG